MPKVVTRAIVATSDQAQVTASASAVLRSYWCLCGDFLLVMQGSLQRLPRRRMDGASIIRCKPGKNPETQPARKFKLNNVVPGKRCLIKRCDLMSDMTDSEAEERRSSRSDSLSSAKGAIRQNQVAYQTTNPPAGSGAFLYIIKGGLTPFQGQIPDDALEGEELLDGLDESEDEERGEERMDAASGADSALTSAAISAVPSTAVSTAASAAPSEQGDSISTPS